MTTAILLIIMIGILFSVGVQNAFIITWQTDNPGTSCSSCITIPTIGTGYEYDLDFDNNRKFDKTEISGDHTYNFETSCIYIIRIRGNFRRIYFNNGGDKEKLNINQWGYIALTSMENAF